MRYAVETTVEFLPMIPAAVSEVYESVEPFGEFIPEIPWFGPLIVEPAAPVILSPARFTANRKALVNRLKSVSAFSPRRTCKPILQTVRLSVNGTVELTACSLEQQITTADDYDRSGDIVGLVNPKSLLAILKTVKTPDVECELSADLLTVKGGMATLSIPVEYDPQEYPTMNPGTPDVSLTVYSADLLRGLSQTMYATDETSTRYAFNGVLFELLGIDCGPEQTTPLILVGSDGRRLANHEVGDCLVNSGKVKDATYVVPTSFLKSLESFIRSTETVQVNLEAYRLPPEGSTIAPGGYVEIIGDTWRAVARLVEGRYPKYRDCVPTVFNREIAFKRVELIDALTIASVATSDESRGVDFSFPNEDGEMTVTLSAKSFGTTQSQMTVRAAAVWQADAGERMDTGKFDYNGVTFDPFYVLEYLRNLPATAEYVAINYIDSESAVVWRAAHVAGYGVVMPLHRDR